MAGGRQSISTGGAGCQQRSVLSSQDDDERENGAS